MRNTFLMAGVVLALSGPAAAAERYVPGHDEKVWAHGFKAGCEATLETVIEGLRIQMEQVPSSDRFEALAWRIQQIERKAIPLCKQAAMEAVRAEAK